MAQETKKVSPSLVVLGIALALIVIVTLTSRPNDDGCNTDDDTVCLEMSVVFDPPKRDEVVRIWVDLNKIRLNTWEQTSSPWFFNLEVKRGTKVRLAANQLDTKPIGVLDCMIKAGMDQPIRNYRTGNGEVGCDYPRY